MNASFVCAAILAWQNTGAPVDRATDLVREIAASGVVDEIVTPAAERVAPAREIAPGAAPILMFRYLEGSERHRFSDLNLVIDDAGH